MNEQHTNTIQRVALYARVSTEEQKEGKNIQSQVAELKSFIISKGWVLTGEYLDEGWSGGLLARPELDRLRDDAEKDIFEAVVVNDVDRFGRDLTNIGIVKRDLERKGIKLLFRKLSNGDSPADDLMVNMMGSFAQFERALIADRTRRGRRYKAETRKIIVGNIPPFGLKYIPLDKKINRDGQYAIYEPEARTVRKMFDWVDHEKLSARAVVRRLTEQKIAPKKGNKVWAKSSVLRILHNQTYAGVTHYNKHMSVEPTSASNDGKYRRQTKTGRRLRDRVEWIPIILPENLIIVSPEQFDRVQAQLQDNLAFSPRNSHHNYLLRGLARCGKCNSPYTGVPMHGKFFYRDGNRAKRFPLPRNCFGTSVSAERLETGTWDTLVQAIRNPRLIAEQVAVQQKRSQSMTQKTETDLGNLQKQLEKLGNEEKRVLEAYKLGAIGPELLKSEMDKVRSEKTRLSQEESDLKLKNQAKVPMALVRKSILDYCRQVEQKLVHLTDEKKQQIMRLLLQQVVIDDSAVKVLGILRAPTPQYAGDVTGSTSMRYVLRPRR